jgi:hypothetical protein
MKMIRGLVIAGLLTGFGCGGDVVVDGPPEQSNTTSTSSGAVQCSIGACGDDCVACGDNGCVAGVCSDLGQCLPSAFCP